MWYVVCCLLQCPSVSVHIPLVSSAVQFQYTQCSHSQAYGCLPPYPLLPPTLPPPATHPTPSCHPPYSWLPGPPCCHQPQSQLPPTLPPPATHPMTCVRTPPPATIASHDINSWKIHLFCSYLRKHHILLFTWDRQNIFVKLRQGSGKDRQGMALKAKGLNA